MPFSHKTTAIEKRQRLLAVSKNIVFLRRFSKRHSVTEGKRGGDSKQDSVTLIQYKFYGTKTKFKLCQILAKTNPEEEEL